VTLMYDAFTLSSITSTRWSWFWCFYAAGFLRSSLRIKILTGASRGTRSKVLWPSWCGPVLRWLL